MIFHPNEVDPEGVLAQSCVCALATACFGLVVSQLKSECHQPISGCWCDSAYRLILRYGLVRVPAWLVVAHIR